MNRKMWNELKDAIKDLIDCVDLAKPINNDLSNLDERLKAYERILALMNELEKEANDSK